MDLKLFGKNTVVYGIGNITLRTTSFLLVPLYTHYLSVEDYGRLETVFVTIQILLIFMGLGIQSSVIRFYKESEERGELSQLLGTSFIVIGTAILTFALLFVFVFGPYFKSLIHSEKSNLIVLLICFAAIVECMTGCLMSIYRAQNKATKFTVSAVSNALLIILFTLLLLSFFKQGLMGAVTARMLGYGLIGVILTFNLINFTPLKFSKEKVRELLSFGFPLIFASSAWFILDASDRYFLAHFVGMHEVGIYALGYKLTFILLAVVVMPFQLAYGPFIFAYIDHPGLKKTMSRLLTYLVFTLIIVGYLIVLFSRDIISLIAPSEYSNAYLVTICIIFVTALTGINYWNAAQLHVVKKTHYIAIFTCIAAILNLLLNYLFIPQYGWVGAAIATNLSFIFAIGTLVIIGQRNFPITFEFRRLIFCAIILIILFLSYVLTNNINRIFYYGFNFTLIILTPLFLYLLGFFDLQEKQFINSVLLRKAERG